LQDYQQGNRTINKEYEPPFNKIKEYKVKEIAPGALPEQLLDINEDPNE